MTNEAFAVLQKRGPQCYYNTMTFRCIFVQYLTPDHKVSNSKNKMCRLFA